MNVENFLMMYGDQILHEHKEEFLRFQEMKLSKYGWHDSHCPWSSNEVTDGPDTCGCVNRTITERKIKKLICLYLRIFKKI